MKKRILLALALCLLLGTLPACSGEKGNADTGSGEPDETGGAEASILDDITVKDYGGGKFVILGVGDESFSGKDGSVVNHDANAESIEKVVFDRTSFLERKYHFTMQYAATNDTYSKMNNDTMSGTGSFDLILPHPTEGITNIYTQGYCANILDMAAIELSHPWFRKSQIETYTVNGKLYQVASDFQVGSPLDGFVYNKELYKNIGLTEDLYDVVFDGDWTMERFFDIVMQYSPETDGVNDDSKMYSLLYHKGKECMFMYGCGIKTVRQNSESEYELALDKDKLNTVASYLFRLVHNSPNVYVGESNSEALWGGTELLNIFRSGRAVFLKYNVGGLYSYLRELTFDIGYLPMPKYDVNQKDYCSISTNGGAIIPSVLSPERQQSSAAVLDALARYGNLYMRQAYYDMVLQGRLSKDPRDYQMLELMLDHPVFDIGFMIDGAGTGKMKGILTYVLFVRETDTVDSYLTGQTAILNALVEQINSIS